MPWGPTGSSSGSTAPIASTTASAMSGSVEAVGGWSAWPPKLNSPRDRERDPQTFSRAFRESGASGPPQRAAGAARRPEHALHLGRNAAAQALLPGRESTARAQARHVPEVPSYWRHRRGGED